MTMQNDFQKLYERLIVLRDEVNLKMHLASMEARDEFARAEKTWAQVKIKAGEIADDTKETSEEYIAKAKIVGEELQAAYQRIKERLAK